MAAIPSSDTAPASLASVDEGFPLDALQLQRTHFSEAFFQAANI